MGPFFMNNEKIDTALKEAFKDAVNDIRDHHPEDSTEDDFRCLLYHYLLLRLEHSDLIGASVKFPLSEPNLPKKERTYVDIALGERPDVNDILVEVKPFWDNWKRRVRAVRNDCIKLQEVIRQWRGREDCSKKLRGYLLTPLLLSPNSEGFDQSLDLIKKARNRYEKKYNISILCQ